MAVDIDGVNSTISTDKLIPQSGTALQIGESGDTISLGSGATASGFGGGKILQVPTPVHKTSSFTTSSTSYVDVTDVTLDITPTATSSRIMIFLNLRLSPSTSYPIFAQFLRDSTVIGSGTGSSNEDCFASAMSWSDGSRGGHTSNFVWLDSPSSTSALTYKLQVRMYGAEAGYVGRASAVHIYAGDFSTSLTLMEIGA
jgi:hypothetical protein